MTQRDVTCREDSHNHGTLHTLASKSLPEIQQRHQRHRLMDGCTNEDFLWLSRWSYLWRRQLESWEHAGQLRCHPLRLRLWPMLLNYGRPCFQIFSVSTVPTNCICRKMREKDFCAQVLRLAIWYILTPIHISKCLVDKGKAKPSASCSGWWQHGKSCVHICKCATWYKKNTSASCRCCPASASENLC